jgi:hypothetical protein
LKCIQINLRHSKTASSALAQVILDLNIGVALVQEPYAYSITLQFLLTFRPASRRSTNSLLITRTARPFYYETFYPKTPLSPPSCPPTTCITFPTCSSGPFSFCSANLRSSLPNFRQSAYLILDKSASPLSITGVTRDRFRFSPISPNLITIFYFFLHLDVFHM